jgi:hypothetical protein
MQAFRTVSEARKYLQIGAAPRTGIASFLGFFCRRKRNGSMRKWQGEPERMACVTEVRRGFRGADEFNLEKSFFLTIQHVVGKWQRI